MALTGRDMIEAARKAVAKIPNDQLQAQLTAGAPVVVIDVREREEWDAGHIPQGTLLPEVASKAASRNSSRIKLRPLSPIERAPRCPGRADSPGDGVYECLLPLRWL